MKKLIPIILTIFLVLSVVGNVYLFVEWQSAKKTLLSEQNAINTTLTEKDSILSEANKKVTELETTISDLQNQIGELETKLDTTTTIGGFIVEIIEPKTMYVISEEGAPVRRGASDDYITDETLLYGQEVTVTGRTANDWYRIQWGDGVVYASSQFFGEKDPLAGNKASKSETEKAAQAFDDAMDKAFGNDPGTPMTWSGDVTDPNKTEGMKYAANDW